MDRLDAFIAALHAYADEEYCRGIRMAHREDKCLGWEHKVKTGKFGPAEKQAHTKMDMHLGAHFGIYAAIKLARTSIGDTPAPQSTEGGEKCPGDGCNGCAGCWKVSDTQPESAAGVKGPDHG